MKFSLNPLALLHRRPEKDTGPIVRTPPQAHIFAGRRYVSGIPYSLPKDFPEDLRLDFQDHFLHAVLGKDYLAPLDPPQLRAILDVGCGTERWAHHMARTFKTAQVTGLDAVPPAPKQAPVNYHFVKGNLLDGLPFADNSFDYTHQRLLVGGIPALRWKDAVIELARVTRPGGWIELLEGGEGFTNPGPNTEKFLQWWRAANIPRGIDASVTQYLDVFLQQANLQHIRQHTIKTPVGVWAGRAGEMLQKNILAGWGGLRGLFVQNGITSEQDFDMVLSLLPKEWNMRQCSYEYYVAWGQKGDSSNGAAHRP